MKKILFGGIFILILNGGSYGKTIDSLQWNISFCPQYIANNCFKIGIEKKLARGNWLGVSPEYYDGPVNTDNTANGTKSIVEHFNKSHDDRVQGIGVNIENKIFLKSTDYYSGYYFAYGLNYTRLNITFQDYAWQVFTKDSLAYMVQNFADGNIKIDQYGGYFGFGYAAEIANVFHVDFFIGGGAKQSVSETDLGDGYRSFKRNFFDYQFSGVHPVLTVQLGYSF